MTSEQLIAILKVVSPKSKPTAAGPTSAAVSDSRVLERLIVREGPDGSSLEFTRSTRQITRENEVFRNETVESHPHNIKAVTPAAQDPNEGEAKDQGAAASLATYASASTQHVMTGVAVIALRVCSRLGVATQIEKLLPWLLRQLQ